MSTPTDARLDLSPGADTESAGQRIDEGKGRIFPCEGCGADLKFHIGQQKLICPFCGYRKEIALGRQARIVEQDLRATFERLSELRRSASPGPPDGMREIRCEACGAQVMFEGTLTSTECAYCGSPVQEDESQRRPDRLPVDGVLPFRVEREAAWKQLRRWIRSRWFAPNAFRRRGIQGRFRGVYLPFWTFDTLTFNRYRGQRGEHYWVTVGSGKNRRRERRTRWYPARGAFQQFFDDVLVAAAGGIPRKLLRALEPWPLHGCLPYTQQVLAGHLARTYEVDLADGFVIARDRIDDALRQEVRRRIGGDVQRIHSIDTRHDAMTFKHLLLPTWLLAYRFRDRVYQVVINAATGEVQGERPWSWVKITLAVLFGLIVAGVVVYLVEG